MAGKFGWKDLAGTAKKWLDAKTTETLTGDRRTREHAEARQNSLEHDMEQQAAGAALTTLFPGLGRAMERQEANRLRAQREQHDRARAQRLAAVLPGSSIELSGVVDGRLDDLAITLTPDDEQRTLLVLVEAVDPAPIGEHRFLTGGFAITGFTGDGRYQLVSDSDILDPGAHHVVLDEDQWFYWTEEYGPGTAVVGGGWIEASLAFEDEASRKLGARFRIPMG